VGPKIAVVGAGYWGKNLIRNLYEIGHLAAICDSNELIKQAYESKYQDVQYVSDYSSILCDESIDAVVLATPAVTHYKMAREALNADKHVFIEKPLALELREGQELIALAEKNSKILMVGHILQYHSAVLKLKEMINRGDLGKIQYIYSNRLNIGKIRTEENILWSFAPHDISVILMLLDEIPETLYACGGNYLQEHVADVTVTTMNFPSGVKAHIFVSWLHPFKEQKLVVVGDKKMAVFDDLSQEKLFLYSHKIEWLSRAPVASKAEAEAIPLAMVEPLKAECRHFVDCIQNDLRPRTDGEEGLRVLRVLSASQESLDKRGAVIRLSDISKEATTPPMQSANNGFFVHDSSVIDKGVEVGKGTAVWHFSHILTGSKIGANCRVGQGVVVGPNVTIGNGCKIQNNVSVYEGVTLEDHVFCGPSMVFTNVFNPRSEFPRMKEMRHTLVKTGATLGANCTIVCGNTIGSYSFVGAGAVVTKDIPDYALVLGNPARISGWVCKCGVKLQFRSNEAVCEACGSHYEMANGHVTLTDNRKKH
jgi:UDP-2-acetamido-3-amino-2,3-dideoxy-glucuronate N-acetyltransferase